MDDLIKAAQAVLQTSTPVEVQKARAQLAAALAAAQGAQAINQARRELPGVYIDRAHALCCKEWQ